jgi:tetratricopeptide (TPR) repeat protein
LGESLAIAREQGDRETVTSIVHKLGIIDRNQGDYAAARTRIEKCLTNWRAMGNQIGTANALESLGDIAWHTGDNATARACYEHSLALRRELEDPDLTESLQGQERVARVEGDYERATALGEMCLALARQQGYRACVVWSLHDLGELARDQGEYARAAALFQESLAIAQEMGVPSWPASMLNRLGELAQAQGDYARAVALHRESLAVFRDLGQKRDSLLCLEGLAWVAEAQEHARRSAVLYGAVAALREATGAQVPPLDRARYAQSVDRVRDRLGEAAFAEAWSEGHAMPLEQAIAYALDEGEDVP